MMWPFKSKITKATPRRFVLPSREECLAEVAALRQRHPRAEPFMKNWRVDLSEDEFAALRFLQHWDWMVGQFTRHPEKRKLRFSIPFIAMADDRGPLHFDRDFSREEVMDQ